MEQQKQYRQGDVLIRSVARIPDGERKARVDGILMHGEVTGHAHRVETFEGVELVDIGEQGCFLSVSEDGVRIVHEEHAPIVLPAGNYEIMRQREYSPEEIRNVLD